MPRPLHYDSCGATDLYVWLPNAPAPDSRLVCHAVTLLWTGAVESVPGDDLASRFGSELFTLVMGRLSAWPGFGRCLARCHCVASGVCRERPGSPDLLRCRRRRPRIPAPHQPRRGTEGRRANTPLRRGFSVEPSPGCPLTRMNGFSADAGDLSTDCVALRLRSVMLAFAPPLTRNRTLLPRPRWEELENTCDMLK